MFTVLLSGKPIGIQNHFPYIAHLCHDYLITGAESDFIVEASESEVMQEFEKNQGKFSLPLCESTCIHRKICEKMLDYDTFIVHAAVIQVDGKAYGFLAHSGVGKSTHMGLWLQHFGDRARVLNGDKPMICYRDGQFYAYGTPWQGKENLGENTHAPLAGLALLERSETNFIREANSEEIVKRIFDQILVPKMPQALENQMRLLNLLIKQVPIYRLGCNLSPEAAEIAARRMCEEI